MLINTKETKLLTAKKLHNLKSCCKSKAETHIALAIIVCFVVVVFSNVLSVECGTKNEDIVLQRTPQDKTKSGDGKKYTHRLS